MGKIPWYSVSSNIAAQTFGLPVTAFGRPSKIEFISPKEKVALIIIFIILSYCNFPFAAQTGGIVAELLTYLIGFNSCLNPWIYFCFNCKNFVIKPRKRKLHTNLTMTTQTQLNTERASIQLSQSCSNRELQEELTPLTETRAIVIENRDAVHV